MRQINKKIVERLIAETGLSERAWAMQYGFVPQTLSAWLTGTRNIGGKNLCKLADALRVQPGEISTVVFKVDNSELSEIERMDQDLLGAFHSLNRGQKERVLRMVQGLADANMAEEELKHG